MTEDSTWTDESDWELGDSDVDEESGPPPVVAVVGRPNVGKSTLVNRLLGQERVIASDVPGTTRDSILIPFRRDEHDFILIDDERAGNIGKAR